MFIGKGMDQWFVDHFEAQSQNEILLPQESKNAGDAGDSSFVANELYDIFA